MRYVNNTTLKSGFTLPVVMIASVVMLMVLSAAGALVSSTVSSLEDEYYGSLASDAARSGIARAEMCLHSNNMTITWSDVKPLRPDTDCSGDHISGRSSFILEQDTFRSTYVVGAGVDAGYVHNLQPQGTVERIRTSTNSVWKVHRERPIVDVNVGVKDTVSISSGLHQVCALLANNIWCNGGNQSGQMGNGRIEPLSDRLYMEPERVLRQPGVLLGKTDKLVGSGMQAACVVTTDNNIYCWGRNNGKQLGRQQPVSWYPKPLPGPVDKPAGMTGEITDLRMGYYGACVVSDGDAWCWGYNDDGQIGDGTKVDAAQPTKVIGIGSSYGKTVTDISTSPYSRHACAVAAGDAYCWGGNKYGQLGTGDTTDHLTATPVTKQSGGLLGKTVTKVITTTSPRTMDGQINATDGEGGYCKPWLRSCYVMANTCALTADGNMYCWGSNNYGQLGQGDWDINLHDEPVRVGGILTSKNIIDIATAYHTPCALTDEPDSGDRYYCWGSNYNGAGGLGHWGKCGEGGYSDVCDPSPVVMNSPGLKDKQIDSIFGGINRNCAIAGGVSYCMGLNSSAQLGDGTTTTRLEPTEAKLFRRYTPSLIY